MNRHLWLAAGCVVLLGAPAAAPLPREGPSVVALARTARDSMGVVWSRFNQHWDELRDLNTMERMLGTIRPTQREYLGCLQGRVRGDTVRIDGWVPAADLKQLQLAVTGNCDSVPHLLGTWHTHPYRADLHNLPIKERRLSTQDLETFAASPYRVMLVMWDLDSVAAAVKRGPDPVHAAVVITH